MISTECRHCHCEVGHLLGCPETLNDAEAMEEIKALRQSLAWEYELTRQCREENARLLEELAAARLVVDAAKDIAHGLDETCGKFPELERLIGAYDKLRGKAPP